MDNRITVLPDFPGYGITPDGRVIGPKGAWLRPKAKKAGYLEVGLMTGHPSRQRWITVHRLVVLAWIGPPPTPEHEVAHWDGNPTNNRVENLRWATSADNAEDKRRHGRVVEGDRHHNRQKTRCPQGHPYDSANTKHDGNRRRCRICSNARVLAWTERRRSELRGN